MISMLSLTQGGMISMQGGMISMQGGMISMQGGMISMQGGMISMQGGMISMPRVASAIMSIKHVGSQSIMNVACHTCRKSHVTSQARHAAL
jgi:hypothetical protein